MIRQFPDLKYLIAKHGEDVGWFYYRLAVDLFYFGSDELYLSLTQ